MKKIFLKKIIIIALLIMCLVANVACGITKIDDELQINVSVLNGTTGFGMAKLMKDNVDNNTSLNYNFKVETDASVVTAALINGDIDIAALPTNAASVVYNKTQGGVKVLALNTLGVLYVVENGNSIKSLSDLDGKTIYCPAQNPAFIMEYIAKQADINVTIDTTYAQPAALMQFIATSAEGTVAVLPEPVLSVAQSKNDKLNTVLDLTAEWNNKASDSQLVQGCVVVRTDFLEAHPKEVNQFLKDYEASVKYVNTNVSETANLVVELEIYAGAATIAEKAIPKCNIKFIDGEEMKIALSGFLAAMESVNPTSIGGKLPDNDFYYIYK